MAQSLVLAALVGVGGLASAAWAVPASTLSADDFKYRWDFNLVDDGGLINDNLDLYNNATGAPGADGVNDWNVTTNTTTRTIHDGVLDLDDVGIQNNLWKSVPDITATSGFSYEFRLHVTSTAEGTNGRGLVMDVAPENPASGSDTSGVGAVSFIVDDTTDPENPVVNLHWTFTATTAGNKKTSVPFNGEFFTVRIVGEYDAARAGNQKLGFSLYVNDALIEGDMGPAASNVGLNRMYVGLIGSDHGGQMELDYLAFHPGAYAPIPVPEPATFALSAIGLLAVAQRRR